MQNSGVQNQTRLTYNDKGKIFLKLYFSLETFYFFTFNWYLVLHSIILFIPYISNTVIFICDWLGLYGGGGLVAKSC